MAQPAPKRMRLSTQDVLHELEKDEEPITAGSDDEFDDLICEEKERDEWGATDTGGTHLSHGSPLRSGGDQISSTSPSLSLSPMTTSTPPHTPTGPSSSRMTNPRTGGDQTSSTSPSLSLSPMAMPIPPHSPTGPSTSHLSRMAPPIPPHSPTVSDPLSLPLSAYLSQPLANFVKDSGQPGYDRLGKVRSILERVQDKLINLYNPHCENAVDEAMIPFQGRSTLKQYMPAKPVKRGIKVWCRADSYNGYMCEVQVYAGRAAETEGGLGMRVVLDLAQHLEGKKYHIYIDNFFTSVTLPVEQLGKTPEGFPQPSNSVGRGRES